MRCRSDNEMRNTQNARSEERSAIKVFRQREKGRAIDELETNNSETDYHGGVQGDG